MAMLTSDRGKIHFKHGNNSAENKSSAIAKGPRDAPCQLKYCQLLHSCMKKSNLKRLAFG